MISTDFIPLLTEDQYDSLKYNSAWAIRNNQCPTCQDRGVYQFKEKEYECPTNSFGQHVQFEMFRRYAVANIGLEHAQLDWANFPYKEEKKEFDDYIENFSTIRYRGMGYEIYGASKGIGKTFAAVGILKEIVKQRYDGWFVSFAELKNYHQNEDQEEKRFLVSRLRNSELLVIDDIWKPWSEPMRSLFEETLEQVIRFRSINNFPTITTTNLVQKDMEKYYPRIASVLSGKQVRIELEGEDYRPTLHLENLELKANNETRPIY